MTRNRSALVALLTLALILSACGKKEDGSSTSTSNTSSTTETTPVTTGGTTIPPAPPISVAPSETTSHLTAVRVETVGDHDRVIFAFDEGVPGYSVAYIDGPLRSDGEGAALAVEGSSIVRVAFARSSAVELTGGYTKTYKGPDRVKGEGTKFVREVVKAGDFESRLSWGIGLGSHQQLTVTTSQASSEVVVTFGTIAAQ